jgi:hypothetical protein
MPTRCVLPILSRGDRKVENNGQQNQTHDNNAQQLIEFHTKHHYLVGRCSKRNVKDYVLKDP